MKINKYLILTPIFLIVFAIVFSSIALADERKNSGDDNERDENERISTSASSSTNWGKDKNDDKDKVFSSSSTSTSRGKEYGDDAAEEHRSEVSKYVQNILKISERDGEIGKKISEAAREQSSSTDAIKEKIDKVEKRSALKTFLIGSDYKNLGDLRSEIAQNINRISQMERDISAIASSTEKTSLLSQIQALKTTQDKLNNFIQTNESKFSLFGWFVRLFNK